MVGVNGRWPLPKCVALIEFKIEYYWLFINFLMKLKDATDGELIDSLRASNSQAMEVLYDRYGGLVYSIAFKILQNSSDAEDLTQEVLIKVITRALSRVWLSAMGSR